MVENLPAIHATGHDNIEGDGIGVMFPGHFKSIISVHGSEDAVTLRFKHAGEHFADFLIVVDDQNRCVARDWTFAITGRGTDQADHVLRCLSRFVVFGHWFAREKNAEVRAFVHFAEKSDTPSHLRNQLLTD